MEKKIILPLDGHPSGKNLLDYFKEIMQEKEMPELVAYIKLNDGLHNFDLSGPAIVTELKQIGKELGISFGIFLDLKIFDVSATVKNVLKKYLAVAPDILTISSQCSVAGFLILRRLLPNTKLALISVPTDISEDECQLRFEMSASEKILLDLEKISEIYESLVKPEDNQKPVDFIVCSTNDLRILKNNLGNEYGYITPGIRDIWMKNPDEHQIRTAGVKSALEQGANLIVMGAQLTIGCPQNNISPKESRRRTLEEMKNFQG